jgi:hypothetical protein
MATKPEAKIARRLRELRDLPTAGTDVIKLSQVKAEFGKGDNLLDYLGEGGVTSSAPLKLTDFYGTSAAPTPIHSWADRIHDESNAFSHWAYATTRKFINLGEGDLVLEAGHYSYGLRSNPGGLNVNRSAKTEKGSGYLEGVSPASPMRWALSAHIIDSDNADQTFTFTGQGDATYWPVYFDSHAFVIPKASLPWNTSFPVKMRRSTQNVNVAINRDGTPNSFAIGLCCAANYEPIVPTISNAVATIGGKDRANHCAHLGAYQIIQLDGNGSGQTDFVASQCNRWQTIMIYT